MDKYDALRKEIENINTNVNEDYIKKLETCSINMAMSECLAESFSNITEKIKTDVMDVKVCIPPVARLHPVMKSREIIGQMSTSRQSPNPHTGTGMEYAIQQ